MRDKFYDSRMRMGELYEELEVENGITSGLRHMWRGERTTSDDLRRIVDEYHERFEKVKEECDQLNNDIVEKLRRCTFYQPESPDLRDNVRPCKSLSTPGQMTPRAIAWT